MDFYVAAATVSPVLLIAVAAALQGRLRVFRTLGRVLITVFVFLPAFAAMVLSLGTLEGEHGYGWARMVTLVAVSVQTGCSLFAIVLSMWIRDPESGDRPARTTSTAEVSAEHSLPATDALTAPTRRVAGTHVMGSAPRRRIAGQRSRQR